MDSRFFSFRGSGIIQQPGVGKAVPYDESAPEHRDRDEEIFKPSDKVIDFSDAKTDSKASSDHVVELENAKVIDRENEGVLVFDQEGSKRKSSKKPKIKRVTTIRDYVKKMEHKDAVELDYIDIDDDEPSKRVFNGKKGVAKKVAEDVEVHLPELDYIEIDEEKANGGKDPAVAVEEAEAREEAASVPLEEAGQVSTSEGKDSIDCPHCGDTIFIPSSRRPITLKCVGCGKKGVLRI